MALQQHWGDLLPLPLPERRTELPGRSRASKRRLHRRRILDHEMGETVIALNHLAGFSQESEWPPEPQTQAHRSSLDLIRDAHRTRQWPRGESLGPRAALDKLLRRSASYGAAAGPLSPYEPGRVSLPWDQRGACPLTEVLAEQETFQVNHFKECIMLPPSEISALFDDVDAFESTYRDPAFEDSRTWAMFVRELFGAKLIRFDDRPEVVIG